MQRMTITHRFSNFSLIYSHFSQFPFISRYFSQKTIKKQKKPSFSLFSSILIAQVSPYLPSKTLKIQSQQTFLHT